jgi:iron-sulfur cluster repair protein YtfE (RIC family)
VGVDVADDRNLVEALTDAPDRLAFATDLIERNGVDADTAAGLRDRIERIRRRLADPRLRLAVVGEFSSGKTTFINALIRRDLFPVSVLPTTATAVRLEYGDPLSFTVRIDDSDREFRVGAADQDDLADLRTVVGALAPGEAVPATDQDLLAVLTSHDDVAAHVTDLTVQIPAAALSSGLVIIDCPGSNGVHEHTEIARRVMTEEADIAVVLISAHAPVSMSLLSFIGAAFDVHTLGRCVFLVTRMDGIATAEQSDLANAVRERLRRHLGIEEPVVFPIAANAVVRESAGQAVDAVGAAWARSFADTERRLLQIMAQHRVVSVSDSILRLLDELLDAVRADLAAREAELAVRQKLIDEARVRDLNAFVQERRDAGVRALTRVTGPMTGSATAILRDYAERTRQTCDALLTAATTVAELKAAVDTAVPASMRSLLAQAWQAVGGHMVNGVEAGVGAARDVVDVTFAEEYDKLGRAVSRQHWQAPPHLDSAEVILATRTHLAQVTTSASAAFQAATMQTTAGAAAGAAIGAVVGGPVGLVIGGWIGAKLASNVEKPRQRLRGSVQAAVDQSFQGAEAMIPAIVADLHARSVTALEAHLTAYRRTYESAVERSIREQQAQAERLAQDRAALRDLVAEADRRRLVIQAQRTRVSTPQ